MNLDPGRRVLRGGCSKWSRYPCNLCKIVNYLLLGKGNYFAIGSFKLYTSFFTANFVSQNAIDAQFCEYEYRSDVWFWTHPGGNPGANPKPIFQRCHPILVVFVWELTICSWVFSRVAVYSTTVPGRLLFPPCYLSLSRSLSLSHTHTHTHTHSLSHRHTYRAQRLFEFPLHLEGCGSLALLPFPCLRRRVSLPPTRETALLSSYTQVFSVMHDSGSVPE